MQPTFNRFALGVSAHLLFAAVAAAQHSSAEDAVTVFIAKEIVTMDLTCPTATAVTVR
jgi:hypothetical protein